MATFHAAATDEQGRLTAPSVLAQIDARTKATMRADLPALADELGIGGGSGSGIEQVSGPITLDASGDPIREFFTTGATTFKANGVDTPLGAYTAVVWRRTAQGSWGYQVVQDGWTTPTPAPAPDTTAPVAGTLAVTVTDVKADLSVSGASDDRGYVQYSFSKDNGSTWTTYQDSASYTFTGLTASTAYQFRHRVKDAAGNVATGAAVTKSTAAPPPTPKSPEAIGALTMHYDPSVTSSVTSASGAVSALADSAGGHTLLQATAANQPTLTTVNGKQAVKFVASSLQSLATASADYFTFNSATGWTIAGVVRMDSGTLNTYLWSLTGSEVLRNGNSALYANVIPVSNAAGKLDTGVVSFFAVTATASALEIRVGSTSATKAVSGAVDPTQSLIMARRANNTGHSDMTLCQWWAHGKALTGSELDSLHAYAKDKWGAA